MRRREFNAFCASLPAVTHVVQWGGSDVWKVGGKVFGICWDEEKMPGITFKASEISFEILRDMPGLRPAPYLASRGLKWIQRYDKPGLNLKDMKHYLIESHRLVSEGLSFKKRVALRLAEKPPKTAKRKG